MATDCALRFTVLRGSVGAAHDGETITLGGPQQRRLLAALLADVETVVSTDRLIDSIWPTGAAPDGARRTVMSYVSRLRSAIGGEHLVTRDTGYELVLDGATYDAADFEQMLADARAAPCEEALPAYDAAIGLWAGRAFGEDGDEWWLRPVAGRLDELHLVALEERAECLIQNGRHADAIADLERLVGEQPLRERFVELLMRALYFSGRQAEALRAFRTYHDYIADETGLPPSDALVELEYRITMGDALLAPSSGLAIPGYELDEVIGEGAFGSVYRAVQPSIGREVAVKVIRRELADDPRFVQRFEAEAQLVARLEHPHVVPLYDFWRRPGGAYLVFRLLRGGSLATRIADGPLSLAEVSQVVDEIGGALGAAHALGVVHRDVKPENVLFDETGNSYLADFGIAIPAADACEAPSEFRSAGSPMYASPEQARDGVATAASDQYALAVVAWEALTGAAPFTGSTATEMFRVKFAGPLPSVMERADVPESLDVVLQRATDPCPDARYPSVGDFSRAWHAALAAADPLRATGYVGVQPEPRALTRTVASMPLVGGNPYKGLRAFREADCSDFYGRADLVAQLVDVVDREPFVAVVGASGAGKSSLVHAGVVPELRRRGDLVVSFVPGSEPLAELEAAIRRVATVDDELTLHECLAKPDGLAVAAAGVVAGKSRLVVVVDQLEELWTLVTDAERDRFVELLANGIRASAPLRVVVTLRADLYDRPLTDAALGPLVSSATFAVTPMTPAELEDAVVRPAESAGVRFEPGLVATIIGETISRPGALPLLQFTLFELYEQRHARTITVDEFRELGGVGGALARRAEDIYASMPAARQAQVHSLFMQLVVPGEEGDDLRRRVGRDALMNIDVEVVEAYRANRLLVTDHHPITREPTIEAAHEALLREWPRLRAWIDEDRDLIRVHDRVGQACADWRAGGRDESMLYRGARLAAADDVARKIQLSSGEHEFLVASHALEDRERSASEHRAARQARQNRRLRLALAAVAVALVLALSFGMFAAGERDRADRQRDRTHVALVAAEVGRVVAEMPALLHSDRSLAGLLAREAVRLEPDNPDARGALLASVTDEPRLESTMRGGISGYLFTTPFPDGHRVVAVAPTGVDLWDVSRHGRVATVPMSSLPQTAAASPDGSRVAVGDGLGVVHVLDSDGLRPTNMPAPEFGMRVADLSFSPDGHSLAVALGAPTISLLAAPLNAPRVIDPATGRTRFFLGGHTTAVNALAFSHDGHFIATVGDDGVLVVHDARNGAVQRRVVLARAGGQVAISPDDRYVAVGTIGTVAGAGLAASVVDLDAPGRAPVTIAGAEAIDSVAFSPDGDVLMVAGPVGARVYAMTDLRNPVGPVLDTQHGFARPAFLDDDRVAFTGSDGTVTVWNLAGAAPTRILAGSGPDAGVFSPDGRLVVTARTDDTAVVQRVADLHVVATISASSRGSRPPLGGFAPVAFSADGRRVAIGDRAGHVQIFETRTFTPDGARVTAGKKPIQGLVFSPNGRLLVAMSDFDISYGAYGIDVASRTVHGVDPMVPTASSAAFTPDGSRLIVTSGGSLQFAVYPVVDNAIERGRPRTDLAVGNSIAISRDGRLVALGTANGTVLLLDGHTLRRRGDPIPVAARHSVSIAIRPDGSLIAVHFLDNTTRLIDVHKHALLAWSVIGDPGGGAVAFSPDGRRLLLPGRSASMLLDLDQARWSEGACARGGRDLSSDEWNRYFSAVEARTPVCRGGGQPRGTS